VEEEGKQTDKNMMYSSVGTGETLHMSQQEKSPLWIQSPEETSRVWIHDSRFSVPVPYHTQLKKTHTHRGGAMSGYHLIQSFYVEFPDQTPKQQPFKNTNSA